MAKTYAVEIRVRGTFRAQNSAQTVQIDRWQAIGTIEARNRGSALRKFGEKFPGRELRAEIAGGVR